MGFPVSHIKNVFFHSTYFFYLFKKKIDCNFFLFEFDSQFLIKKILLKIKNLKINLFESINLKNVNKV